MTLYHFFKDQRVCLAFITVTTALVGILDKFKMQSLDIADNAATARKIQPQADG